MKIISANLNGIRSAAKKNFFDWMAKQNADFVCVQELKAQQADMTPEFSAPHGFHGHFHYAEKKGYSGTGVYSRLGGMCSATSSSYRLFRFTVLLARRAMNGNKRSFDSWMHSCRI
jgi:exonuclease III